MSADAGVTTAAQADAGEPVAAQACAGETVQDDAGVAQWQADVTIGQAGEGVANAGEGNGASETTVGAAPGNSGFPLNRPEVEGYNGSLEQAIIDGVEEVPSPMKW